MKNTLIIILCAVAITIASVSLFMSVQSQSLKIGYIRSADLLYNYKGMQDATVEYETKATSWKQQIKIAELEYQATLDQYRNAVENMSAEDVQTNEQYMFGLREKHIQFADSIQQLARSTDETISNAVVKEVNEMVIEYASKNNYDMIYGTSAAGNVVYGSDALDLTDLLTEVVNKNYEEE
ncbi:MAG: OmpH family outer membrane protein [Flavobacteriales bacterium]|nr:OmpH family outer membrane protein [Flavobacteriales bacterium]